MGDQCRANILFKKFFLSYFCTLLTPVSYWSCSHVEWGVCCLLKWGGPGVSWNYFSWHRDTKQQACTSMFWHAVLLWKYQGSPKIQFISKSAWSRYNQTRPAQLSTKFPITMQNLIFLAMLGEAWQASDYVSFTMGPYGKFLVDWCL